MGKCAICKDHLSEESPDFIYGLNPLTFRDAEMHFQCCVDAYDELTNQLPKDARFKNRQEEYDQRGA